MLVKHFMGEHKGHHSESAEQFYYSFWMSPERIIAQKLIAIFYIVYIRKYNALYVQQYAFWGETVF